MSKRSRTSSQENDLLMDLTVVKGRLEKSSKDVNVSFSSLDKSWPSSPSGKRSPRTDSYDEYAPPRKSAKFDSYVDPDFNPDSPFYDAGSSSWDSDEPRLVIDERLCYACGCPELFTQNCFVECMNCQNCYHYNCASPPVNEDFSNPDAEPEFRWTCKHCTGYQTPELEISTNSQPSSPSSCASTVLLTPPMHIRMCSRSPIHSPE